MECNSTDTIMFLLLWQYLYLWDDIKNILLSATVHSCKSFRTEQTFESLKKVIFPSIPREEKIFKHMQIL